MKAALVILSLCIVQSIAQNSYPIVLLHGFTGWDRDELLGIKYWGGIHGDVQEYLKSKGYSVYTAAVGPVSSTWDRATELYTRIAGGQVDYGKSHSDTYGHARKGRTYSALYSSWGQVVNGQVNKVHIVCHSQGGQDARLLAYLLKNGSPAERAAASDYSPLFAGGKDWIASITTIDSPHDGTTLATGVDQFIPFAQQLVGALAGILGIASNQFIYDFKLDQFGLQRQQGESLSSYQNRVWSSNIWNSKDVSLWSLSPDGAAETNALVGVDPNIFYFTYASLASYKSLFSDHQLPSLTQLLVLWPFTTLMGSYTRNVAGKIVIDSSWFQSDGVVNYKSQKGPTLSTSAQIVTVNNGGILQRGKFNYLGTLSDYDHLDIIGVGEKPIMWFFDQVAALLKSLPVGTGNVYLSQSLDLANTTATNVTLNCDQAKEAYYTLCAVNATTSLTTVDKDDCKQIGKNVNSLCNNIPILEEVSSAVTKSISILVSLFVFIVFYLE